MTNDEASDVATAKAGEGAWRRLPSVDRLLRAPAAAGLLDEHGRGALVATVREVLDAHRDAGASSACPSEESLLRECAQRLASAQVPSLRRVLNLTGTVLHTNLGRACLPEAAVRAACMAMASPTNLEFDIEDAGRGDRDSHVEALLCRLTGAEAATVVNNNAAAVLLALSTVAAPREVVVSRGELVEIGGAFRVPDVMSRAGCRLREVGTTNRTHLRDFESAIGEGTGALMKVHASNYAIVGFTAEVQPRELAQLAHRRGLPFLIDLGSGSLLDLRQFGLPHEPTAREAIEDGADAVTFSGDKLLGGPQCGIIVGSKEWLARMRSNPLKRALRVDKITLAALEATLRLYLNPERARREIPTLRMLTRSQEEIRAQARGIVEALRAALKGVADVAVVDCMSQIGSGSRPVDLLPSAGFAVTPHADSLPVAELARRFRSLPVPVIGRVSNGTLLFDLRCLGSDADVVAQLSELRTGR